MDFPRLTTTAQQAFDRAYREARRLDHAAIQPEHLALGLALDTEGKVAQVFRKFSVDSRAFRLRIEQGMEPGDPLDDPEFELGVRTRQIVRMAEQEASDLGQFGVEAEHLLLALLRDDRTTPFEVLREMGLRHKSVYEFLDKELRPQRAMRNASNRFEGFVDFLREPFRLAGRRKPPVEVSLVFIGLVLFTALAGILVFQHVLPVLTLILFVTGGWLISLCLHEFGHALIGYIGGDTAVYSKGYLSLNPVKYTHPILSIVLPLVFLFMGGIGLPGGAVYINRAAIRDRRLHSLVSAAGPLASLACAIVLLVPFVSGLAYLNTAAHHEFWAGLALLTLLQISAILLNLIPFPGLDGYGILEPFLPSRIANFANSLRPFMFVFLMIVFLSPVGQVFWIAARSVSSLVNLDYNLVFDGLSLFRFWL